MGGWGNYSQGTRISIDRKMCVVRRRVIRQEIRTIGSKERPKFLSAQGIALQTLRVSSSARTILVHRRLRTSDANLVPNARIGRSDEIDWEDPSRHDVGTEGAYLLSAAKVGHECHRQLSPRLLGRDSISHCTGLGHRVNSSTCTVGNSHRMGTDLSQWESCNRRRVFNESIVYK